MEVALEAGAEDVVSQDDGAVDVVTTPETFSDIKAQLEDAGLLAANAEITMSASTMTSLDKTQAEKVIRLIDMLEDLDDVQNVYSNADISADIMTQL